MVIITNFIFGATQFFIQLSIILKLSGYTGLVRNIAFSTIVVQMIYFILAIYLHVYSFFVIGLYNAMLFLMYRFIFRKTTSLSLLLAISQIALSLVIEYVGSLFMMGIKRYHVIFDKAGVNIIRAVMTVILLVIYIIIAKNKISLEKFLQRKKINRTWVAYLAFLVLFTLPFLINIEYKPSTITSAVFVVLIIIIVFLLANFIFIRNYLKMTIVSEQLQVQKMYLRTLEESLNELRLFKHNFANIMLALGGYTKAKDWVALEQYMNSLNLEFLKINTRDVINQSLKSTPIIYNFILSKLSFAELHGIVFNISIQCDIALDYCSDLDFSLILGMLLDNAFEATLEVENKQVDFEILQEWDQFVITIANACKTEINMEMLFHDGYTTKLNHSGVGLGQIRQLVQKYRKRGYAMNLHTEINGTMFTQILRI